MMRTYLPRILAPCVALLMFFAACGSDGALPQDASSAVEDVFPPEDSIPQVSPPVTILVDDDGNIYHHSQYFRSLCDNGHRIYLYTAGENASAAVAVVPDDPSCTTSTTFTLGGLGK